MQVGWITRSDEELLQLIALCFFVLTSLVSCTQHKVPESNVTVQGVFPVADSTDLPDVITTLIRQSDKQAADKNFSGALATLERAVRINPKHAEVWSRMAQLYLMQGNKEQAKQHAKRSNSVIKNNPPLQQFNNQIIQSQD